MRAAFEAEGYRVFEAETLSRGVIEAGTRKPDLIVLDLGLPDGGGVALVRDVRGWSSVPIIVLSARVDETDKVTALDAGADDYLVKPFGVAEAHGARPRRAAASRARRRRIAHRRGSPTSGSTSPTGASRAPAPTSISRRLEFRLLATLVAHPGKVLTHRHLLREVWVPPTSSTINHYLRIYDGPPAAQAGGRPDSAPPSPHRNGRRLPVPGGVTPSAPLAATMAKRPSSGAREIVRISGEMCDYRASQPPGGRP